MSKKDSMLFAVNTNSVSGLHAVNTKKKNNNADKIIIFLILPLRFIDKKMYIIKKNETLKYSIQYYTIERIQYKDTKIMNKTKKGIIMVMDISNIYLPFN